MSQTCRGNTQLKQTYYELNAAYVSALVTLDYYCCVVIVRLVRDGQILCKAIMGSIYLCLLIELSTVHVKWKDAN